MPACVSRSIEDVPEVDAPDGFLGRHVGHEPPEGLAFALGPEVPQRVHDGSQGEVDHALFGPDPPERESLTSR